MPKRLPFWIAVVGAALGLVASAILLVDYARPAPVFCGLDGGCGAVRHTSLAYPMHVPLPVFGVSGLLAVGFLALVPGRRARIAQAVLATFGAIVAAGLLVVQAVIGTFCPYCVVVDSMTIALVGVSIARAVKGWDPPTGQRHVVAGGALLLAAVVAPLSVGFAMKPRPMIPEVILAEMRATPPGKITVVDFADFECPFCRMTHAELSPLLEERKDRVRVVRKHVPLRMHPHAMDAARAACCGEKLGKGEAMADALFAAPKEDLTKEGCEKIALSLGLDAEAFRACLRDAAIDARIKQDSEAFRAAKGHGLPTLWIEGTKLEGAQDREGLAPVLDTAIRAL
jgi:predicted DsbA family dithiol-disulfide isomerase/uncharacterized membrane protein